MKIKFLGAARTVTGSCYMIETHQKRFAIDCGMHQGSREIDKRNRNVEVYNPGSIDFFIITHAHIDHSGLLPLMVKNGFKGPIYTTPPTRDLLEIMLMDSAHIQEMEAAWNSKKRLRHGNKPIEPLYTKQDALDTMSLFETFRYNEKFQPFEELTTIFRDAGHILGSAMIEMWLEENGARSKLVFSGDLGRPNQLLMSDPSNIEAADYLFLESTYGNRDHKDEQTSRNELAEAIAYSYGNGEKVIIPAFAVERTQEILYTLFLLAKEGRLPADMPVFLDSPLAIKATEVFKRHDDYLDRQTRDLINSGNHPLDLPNLKISQSAQDSMSINTYDKPAVIIAGSGMCNAGRVKHHLRHNLWRPGASIVFVGFQARGTPGRKIVDGAKKIRILSEDVAVKAKVFTIGGFSAHAGQSQILEWLDFFRHPDMEIFLVHGEETAINSLAGLIKEKYDYNVSIPDYLDELTVKIGVQTQVAREPEEAAPRIDWEFLLSETEAGLLEIKKRLENLQQKPWVDQTEIRDRLLDIERQLTELASEV